VTFSIVARCRTSGMFGVAVCSSSPAVAARCAFARAGVGAATSQNITDPTLGSAILQALTVGVGAQRALDNLVATQLDIAYRQMTVVDASGETAVFSGSRTLGVHAAAKAQDVAAAGNMLASEGVPAAMVAAFQASEGDVLGERLLAALRAAMAAGGEAGQVHSAGLKIVDKLSWPKVDLRVDWAEVGVIDQLQAVWEVYAPQADDYVTRAVRPGGAPGYGVPGDP
jgi:uncharacterized Ntn-hydrolase superfamily protein